jgi:hypothetical protein
MWSVCAPTAYEVVRSCWKFEKRCCRWYMSVESHGGMILTGEIKELGERPVPLPLCPPQIPHGLTGVLTWDLCGERPVTLPEPWHHLAVSRVLSYDIWISHYMCKSNVTVSPRRLWWADIPEHCGGVRPWAWCVGRRPATHKWTFRTCICSVLSDRKSVV